MRGGNEPRRGGKDVHMESFGNVPEMKICQMGIKCKPEGLWYRGIAAGLRLFQMAFWLQKKDTSRLPNVSHHKNANATGSCAALRLPLPSMIVVSRRHDAKFSPTFINSWQRAAPEFPMIPPVLCVILPHLSLFARSHSVPLMAELLTLFLVLCTLDTTLIFPACVTEHLL